MDGPFVTLLIADLAGAIGGALAGELVLGENTVKAHVARVLGELGPRDRVRAVVPAYESGPVAREG